MKKESLKPQGGSKLSIERIIGVATAAAGFCYVSLQAVQKLVEIVQSLF